MKLRTLLLLICIAALLAVPVAADPAPGYISVTTNPTGGQIYLDNKYIADSTGTAEAKPGTHLVTIKSPEYFTWSDEVYVRSGETTTVNAVLKFYKSPGSLGVTSSMPEVDVYIDDMYYASVKSGTVTIPNLAPQTHDVRIVKAGYHDFLTTVEVLPDKIVGIYSDQKRDTADAGLRIKSEPQIAAVFLDDSYIGTTLSGSQWLQAAEIEPGTHTLSIYKDGYTVWTATQEYGAGSVLDITATLKPVETPTATPATPVPTKTEQPTFAPPAPTQSALPFGVLTLSLLSIAALLISRR